MRQNSSKHISGLHPDSWADTQAFPSHIAPISRPMLGWLPDEYLFSLVARNHTYWGHRFAEETIDLLFGTRGERAAWPETDAIDIFVAKTEGRLGGPLEIFECHTLLRFYQIFMRHQERARYFSARKDFSEQMKFPMALWNGSFTKNHPLRACAACMVEDEADFGMSFWHLQHQYPGVFICLKHNAVLQNSAVTVLGMQRFLFHTPVMASLLPPSVAVHKQSEKDFLVAALLIQNLTADMQKGDLRRARSVLCERAKAQNIVVYPTKNAGYRLSDKIFSRYPGSWLELVFPQVSAKSAGEVQHQLDGILYCSTSSSSIMAYLLGACVLFDNADDFLHALADAGSSARVTRGNRKEKTERKIELHEGLASYIRCKGNHAKIACEHGVPVNAMRPQLLALGLPNLGSAKKSSDCKHAMALQYFYSHQKSLEESARLADLPVEEIEAIVRQAGVHLPVALRQMDLILSRYPGIFPICISGCCGGHHKCQS